MKRTSRISLVALALCMVLTLGASALAEETLTESAPMSEWNGEWISVLPFLDDPAFVEAAGTMAEGVGMTGDELMDVFKSMFANDDIAAMNIEDTRITFLDAPGGEAVAAVEYAPIDVMDLGGYTVSAYEAQGDTDIRYLLLMPAEIDESGVMMSHFHMRYGSDPQEMSSEEKAMWYPTMVLSDTTVEQVIAGCEEFVAESFGGEEGAA